MLPSETQQVIEKHAIKYVLAQFVDIHGSAKTKSVPVSGLEAVAETGAGFAGFAICGMGMEPHGPDFMAKGDLSTLIPVPWQPGYGRVVCIGHVDGQPWPYDSRYVLQQQVERLKAIASWPPSAAFLRPVRPEIAVHAAVHRLAMLVQAGAPGIVPHAPPVGLFLEADQFGNFRPGGLRRLEGSQLRQAAGAGTDDGDALIHVRFSDWR